MSTTDFLNRFLPGSSAAVVALRNQVELLNSSRNLSLARTVLITGESGAGKNHLARVLAAHREYLSTEQNPLSEEAGLETFLGRYDEIHLPALPDTLLESELFGHKRGAFTGAERDKVGLLSDDANVPRSDILLDEIGDASPQVQSKLLQVIERGEFRPLGGEPGEEEETSARLIMATNKSLEDEVAQGRLREDLYWRLLTFRVQVVPLREQPENIRPIAISILEEMQQDLPVASLEELQLRVPEADIAWAQAYPWPGNVRQLRSALQLWLFYGGARTLQSLVETSPVVPHEAEGPHLISLLEDPDAQTLDEVLRKRAEMDKAAIVRWYRSCSRSDEELLRHFPGMQPRSVRQRISDWSRSA